MLLHKSVIAGTVAVLSVSLIATRARQAPANSGSAVIIDADAPTHPFPHFWEQIFGSGRANLSLRESYRNDLREVRKITDCRYVRFHAIFHDENGVYAEDAQGRPSYNFSYVDQIYDGLLENGVRPFVELSFMPQALASSPVPHDFWYKPFVSPPKDYSRWAALVEAFAAHLVARYGLDEVAGWYFEIWNEPNIDFWTGVPKEATYYHLYDEAARAIKRIGSRLRVGGPATAQAAWAGRFIAHCVSNNVPVDFVSTHAYANDTPEDLFGTHEPISRRDMLPRAARKVFDEVKASARPGLPVIWSEFNASYMNERTVTDSPFMGPWLAETISRTDGLATAMSYWTFSDVFEEKGVVKTPFYGGYGLIAAGGIPKAAFNAFRLLHQLGTERIAVKDRTVLATRRPDGSLVLAVWNYAGPDEAGSPVRLVLSFRNLKGRRGLRIQQVDGEHGSPLGAWKAMGEPAYPTATQLAELRRAAEFPPPEIRELPVGESPSAAIELKPHALALIEVR